MILEKKVERLMIPTISKIRREKELRTIGKNIKK
jgi:hypothetical protein